MNSIADFRIIRQLGQGQFGETYEAIRNGEHVALKIIKEEAVLNGFDVKRFQREVRALQKAVGPNVIKFVDAGAAPVGIETRYYVAMELLEGMDLAHWFERKGKHLDDEELVSVLVQVTEGLRTIHSANIVHRDLKPANIYICSDGTAKLLDFGLVKMLDYTTLTTLPGQPIGTPLYMAPEILRGDERIDYRADFYSLGVLIYFLVTTGNYPITALTPIELYMKVVNQPPAYPTKRNKALSPEFENLILTLLSKQPYERTFDHDELIHAFRTTPVTAQSRPQTQDKPLGRGKKICYFRLMHNEKSDVEMFARAGGKMDGIVYPANFLPRYKNSLGAIQELGFRYFFDPVTYRLAYASYALTQGLVELPYVLDRNSVMTPDDLKSIQAQRRYSHSVVDWQIQWGCSMLVSPFHFCRDLGSPWLDIDIKLLEESRRYATLEGDGKELYAGLCLNIETFTVKNNRVALLNRFSRGRADGHLFYLDSFDERTNNPLQIRAYLELLKLFQELGKPVVACRVGTVGLGFLCAGIDGMTSGIASLSNFSENELLQNRSTGYNMKRKYYIPGLMLALSVEMARDILADKRNEHLKCDCAHCRSGTSGLDRIAKPHFLRVRTEEVDAINGIRGTKDRLQWFNSRIAEALRNCEQLRKQNIVHFGTGYYSHLKAWQQVFGK